MPQSVFLLFMGLLLLPTCWSCSVRAPHVGRPVPSASRAYQRGNPLAAGEGEYNPRVLIVFYDSAVGPRPLLKAARKWGSEVIYHYRTFSGMALSVPETKGVELSIPYFKKVRGVLQVSRDRINHLHQPAPALMER